MSAYRNDGGSAFPSTREEFDLDNDRWRTVSDDGMTLRDYFAAKAMQTLLVDAVLPTKADRDEWFPMLGDIAYEVADALLKAREA